MSWRQSASEQSQLCELSAPTFGFTMQYFSMVGSYTENLEKPQNYQYWGMGTCTGIGTFCLGRCSLLISNACLHLYFVHSDTLYAIIGALVGVIAMLFLAIILAIFFVTRCVRRQRLRGTFFFYCSVSFTFMLHPTVLKEEFNDANFSY